MKYPNIRSTSIAIDTETTGLRWWIDEIFAIAIATPTEQYYFDIRKDPEVIDWLSDELNTSNNTLVFHNAKFDIHFMRECGIDVPMCRVDDTMIRAALIDEHRLRYDLDSLGKDILGFGKIGDIYQDLADLFGGNATKNVQMKNLHKAPGWLAGRYAKRDVEVTLALWQWQENEIKNQDLHAVSNLERELLPVLVDMEHRGVCVDVKAAEDAIVSISKMVDKNQKELNKIAGFEINPNPSGSIHELFKPEYKNGEWVLIDGTIAPSTGAGKASINADVLRRMKHPAADLILKIRKMLKTRDTFLKGHILSYHHNGMIHANFNQTKGDNNAGTGTGRLSINSPALQQIPKRDKDIASITRSVFLPDEGQVFHCRDWAQMDFRVFAHYLNDPMINKIYNDDPDSDFHQITAEITGLPRSARFSGDANAKQINLGMVFGMGAGTLAENMGLPYSYEDYKGYKYKKPGPEAEDVFKRYHSAIPGIRDLLNKAESVAKSRGYIKTVMGRHIRFPGGKFTHKAGGLIFQGSAADCLKVKLVELHNLFKGTEGRLLFNVHDEFDTTLPGGSVGNELNMEIERIVHDFGNNSRINFRIPIRSDDGAGKNWWEAC